MTKEFIGLHQTTNGKYELLLPNELRESLWHLISQYKEFLDPNLPDARRLFPTAYPQDPEKEAGYQVFSQNQLIDQKNEDTETIKQTLHNTELTEQESEAWMRTLNDIRLILGTRLDISEDTDLSENQDEFSMLYEDLTALTGMFVHSLNSNLSE